MLTTKLSPKKLNDLYVKMPCHTMQYRQSHRQKLNVLPVSNLEIAM